MVITTLTSVIIAKTRQVKERTYIAAVKKSMTRILYANELYYEQNGRYAGKVALANRSLYTDETDVNITITSNDTGYRMHGWHRKTKAGCTAEVGLATSKKEYDGKFYCAPDGPPLGRVSGKVQARPEGF